MEKLGKILKVAAEYWLFITLGLSGVGALITGVHNYYVMPEHVEPTVREISYRLYMDSAAVWEERRKLHATQGFRGHLSELTSVPKDQIADSIASLYAREENVYMSITYLMDQSSYQVGFNSTVFLMTTQPYQFGGVSFRKTETKENGQFDIYYKDDFNKWWKAIYYSNEDAFFFIPSYTNGERIKCD